MEIVQIVHVEPNPEDVIITDSFLMTPVSENASSDVSVSYLNGRKNKSQRKTSFSLSSPAVLPTNGFRGLFKCAKKRKEKNIKIIIVKGTEKFVNIS